MEIRTLRYFLAVAREENMTRAAELLHVTQPTLSKALKALEDELGKKLFTRHSFSIALTEEGVLLRDRAEDLVTMADKIEKEFLSLDDITGGELYFGLAESYQIRYLAKEPRALKAQYESLPSASEFLVTDESQLDRSVLHGLRIKEYAANGSPSVYQNRHVECVAHPQDQYLNQNLSKHALPSDFSNSTSHAAFNKRWPNQIIIPVFMQKVSRPLVKGVAGRTNFSAANTAIHRSGVNH